MSVRVIPAVIPTVVPPGIPSVIPVPSPGIVTPCVETVNRSAPGVPSPVIPSPVIPAEGIPTEWIVPHPWIVPGIPPVPTIPAVPPVPAVPTPWVTYADINIGSRPKGIPCPRIVEIDVSINIGVVIKSGIWSVETTDPGRILIVIIIEVGVFFIVPFIIISLVIIGPVIGIIIVIYGLTAFPVRIVV